MYAQQLRTPAVIQQRGAGQDETGQPFDVWETVCECWADLRHLSGLESVRGDGATSIVKASARIRYRTGITAAMRLTAEGVTYNIVAVMPDVSRKQYIDLALEVAA